LDWRLGGHGDKRNANDPKGELHDSYFLGPPFPLGNKLFAIHEKAKELRLAILDPGRRGAVERIVPLAEVRDSLLEDGLRRLHAAHVVYGNRILICPTNAGTVIGVDLEAQKAAWKYVYREDKARPKASRDAREDQEAFLRFDDWRNTSPVVVGDKVVLTAPDAPPIHCLNVKDGSLVWKTDKKSSDQYLAGAYGDKVLIVGKETCRALNLGNGQEAWSLTTGLPSGRGVADGKLYFLPLQSAAATGQPEVCVIDIGKGQVVAHARSDKVRDSKIEVPGNLLFFDDKLLSQSPARIVAYPLLAPKLRALDEAIQRNPKDPVALIDRAQVHAHRGELARAVEDLRSALVNGPAPELRERARLLLFETLTSLLQQDFNAREKDLKEYEELCKVERLTNNQTSFEERRRRGVYLTVVARGLEKEGKLVEALDAYLDFVAHARPEQLMPAPDDPAVKVAPDAWARGRVTELLKRATPAQRKQLEEAIEKRRK
jgi:hypothetical protein